MVANFVTDVLKVFLVHVMKAYRKIRGITPFIFNLSARYRYVVYFTPGPLYPW
jgi:hypothetical protein